MTDIRSKGKPAHLTPLPVKSFSVKPGEVVGGLVYVMEKPLGIEEGMIGISVDSPAYQDFIKKQIALLQEGTSGDKKLQRKFDQLEDKKPTKPPTDEEVKSLIGFPAETRTPETAEIARTIFKLYKKSLEITKAKKTKFQLFKEKFGRRTKAEKTKEEKMDEISKLITAGNTVYMVKQDGEIIFGRTGPTMKSITNTTNGQRLTNPFILILTLGLPLAVWKGIYLWKNKPVNVNADAITEAVSTKIAAAKGFPAQGIDTIEGTYSNRAPKIATILTWTPGCEDLGGRLGGGVLLKTQAKKYGILAGLKYMFKKKPHEELISNDSVYGLGESLIAQISLGDRDGIGSKGQNKAIIPLALTGEQKTSYAASGRNFTHQFYGIDFGKSYQTAKNPIIDTLQDDFSFTNPSGITNLFNKFKNYSMLYDNPLKDKMKGVYMLAALRGKLTDSEKSKIVEEYSINDPIFAEKLKNYPGDNPGVDGDLKLIDQEIRKYNNLAGEHRFGDKKDPKKEKEYDFYVEKLKEIKKNTEETDKKILKVFEARLKLTPTQIDLIDNLEKLTAKKATMRSPDGKVLLNHIRVQPKDRIKWQLVKEESGVYKLFFEASDPVVRASVKAKIEAFLKNRTNFSINNKSGITNVSEIKFNLNEEELQKFSEIFTEELVAKHRDDTKKDFNEIEALKGKTSSKTRPRSQSVRSVQVTPDLNVPSGPPYTPLAILSTSISTEQTFNHHPIAIQENASLQGTIDYSKEDKFEKIHPNIIFTSVSKLKNNDNGIKEIRITLKDKSKEGSKEIPVTIKASPNTEQLKYFAPANLSAKNFNFTAKEICRLAVFSAKSNALFDFSKAPAEKKQILEKAFTDAYTEAMGGNPPKFTEETRPRLKSEAALAQAPGSIRPAL